MTEQYQITFVAKPEEEWGIIGGGLQSYNIAQAGDNNYEVLCFVLRDAEEEIVGGMVGATYWDWLYVDLLWVKEELRDLGYGRKLLEEAEVVGRERGAQQAYLDTFSFQAPGFYEKCGYEVFGELSDFPPGSQRFFMRKTL